MKVDYELFLLWSGIVKTRRINRIHKRLHPGSFCSFAVCGGRS